MGLEVLDRAHHSVAFAQVEGVVVAPSDPEQGGEHVRIGEPAAEDRRVTAGRLGEDPVDDRRDLSIGEEVGGDRADLRQKRSEPVDDVVGEPGRVEVLERQRYGVEAGEVLGPADVVAEEAAPHRIQIGRRAGQVVVDERLEGCGQSLVLLLGEGELGRIEVLRVADRSFGDPSDVGRAPGFDRGQRIAREARIDPGALVGVLDEGNQGCRHCEHVVVGGHDFPGVEIMEEEVDEDAGPAEGIVVAVVGLELEEPEGMIAFGDGQAGRPRGGVELRGQVFELLGRPLPELDPGPAGRQERIIHSVKARMPGQESVSTGGTMWSLISRRR